MSKSKNLVNKTATYKTTKEKSGDVKETSGEVENLHADFISPDKVHRVGTAMALTRNLGNYQSTKFTVWIDYPTSKKDIEKTFTEARSFCKMKVQEFSDEVDKDLGVA